ncbi:TIGR03767 family metallophosphoesterase [Actinomadura scrupuli]|uniref:TIGR03767 family metallophosphoesterase n=1 Tax=Actinomadura scrupuli TaxID=559629 RepID=UPI003D9557F2
MTPTPQNTPRAGSTGDSGRLTRRRMLKFTAAGAGLAVLPARPATAASAVKAPAPLKGSVAGTTLDRTLLLGSPGAKGYRPVVAGPGEPHLLRRDLGGTASPARTTGRRPVLVFGHLTDVHIVDSQSPARVEYLDRADDPGSPLALLPFTSSHRPQELLTTQVAEAMVRAVNKVTLGPVTGTRPAFTINTGDAADNVQLNEVRWVIDLLDGKRIHPDSGDLGRYEGVMDLVGYDRRYWHPDGAPDGARADLPHADHGFPTVKGLLDAARAPFQATGLDTPWLAVFGNHDGLVQGNLPINALLNAMATGAIKITAPADDAEVREIDDMLRNGDGSALRRLASARSGLFRMVTPDPRRRLLSRAEVVREHFSSGGGHGFTRSNLVKGTAYYAFTRGKVRGIVLDTVNPNGYADGSIDEEQLSWLEAQLTAASSRYLRADGKVVRHAVTDRLVVIFSHHTLATMNNPLGGGRVLAGRLEALLLRFPNVVLWVNGHTHVNEVTPHPRAAAAAVKGGFWEVSTAAHIDWPQQSRVMEIADNLDGTLSIFATVVDSAAPESYAGKLGDPLHLASLSRELAGNDWQEDNDLRRGKPEDRNVELLVPAPF